MSGSVTGDYGKLSQIRRGLSSLAERGFRDCMETLAGKAKTLTKQSFANGREPDGFAWEPTLKGNSPLQGETGELEAQASAIEATSRGIRVTVSLPYARIHQHGGWAGRNREVKIVARPYLPSEEVSQWPRRWLSGLEASVDETLHKFLPR